MFKVRHSSISRVSSLFSKLLINHSGDKYLQESEIAFKSNECLRSILRTYNRAFKTLDIPSWELLKSKAIANFSGKSTNRGKNSFFNHLNEAFAYRYLHQRGCKLITIVPATTKHRSPDLSFIENGIQRFCEVKTIEISEDEIGRTICGSTFDATIYCALSLPFLNKLDTTLSNAADQMSSQGSGLVYLIVNFDDFTLKHYSTYKYQLVQFLRLKYPMQEVYIKIGMQSRKRIHNIGRASAAKW